METVIRSPHKGVVAKLVHKEGVSLKSMTKVLTRLLTGNRIFAKLGLYLYSSKRYTKELKYFYDFMLMIRRMMHQMLK